MTKKLAILQLLLIVGMSFSYAYQIEKTNELFPGLEKEKELITLLRNQILKHLSKGLVSAQESPVATCKTGNDGTICQEYSIEECENQCSDSCFPGFVEEYTECTPGTCIDQVIGTCTPETPRFLCEGENLKWDLTTPASCNRGCCKYANTAQFITEAACNYVAQTTGQETNFELVQTEIECLAQVASTSEGACVFENEVFANTCKFTTHQDCLATYGGEFFEGILCSNEGLNTNCEKQSRTGCVADRDEVYWFDSCGNKENIYDENRARSWNLGKVLPKGQSCSLGSANNPLSNQASCGNCDRLAGVGSICGSPTEEDKLPLTGEFVCKDLSCVDEWGDERKHGESWCAFDSSIGVQGSGNEQKSVDIPGSAHYRKSCIDGEVRTHPCAPYRNEVCTESRDESTGYSSAACVLNQWQICIDANLDAEDLEDCEENEFCQKQTVTIDKGFAFDSCVPEHPPGFDLEKDPQSAETICSIGTKECTIIYVKKLSGWKCEHNCHCRSPAFTESLNNLCMSLGDCGASYNIEGDLSEEGYSWGGQANGPLSQAYFNTIKSFVDPKKGQRTEVTSIASALERFGITPDEYENPSDFVGDIALGSALTLGLTGVAVLGVSGGLLLAGSQTTTYGSLLSSKISLALNPAIAGSANFLAGAAIGAAVVSILLEATGVGAGLDEAAIYTLVGVGALGGGIALASTVSTLFSFGTTASSALCASVVGCIIGVVVLLLVIITIVIFQAIGIGDQKERIATFGCHPWQPVRGGDNCAKCDESDLPCTRYKCQSLGQTCRFINEGTTEQACININPNDPTAPMISPDREALSEGYEYAELDRSNLEIKQADGQCMAENTLVEFGINVDEPASCIYELQTDSGSYDDMPNNYFSGSLLLREKHKERIIIPSLAQLGIPEEFRDQVGDYRMYIRCKDANGNSNVAPYVVNFCARAGQDNLPPSINKFTPLTNYYAGFGETEHNVKLHLNKPAECRWSNTDIDYGLMQNSLECEIDFKSRELDGWPCETTLPLTSSTDTETFFFRCKNQPWLEGNETEEEFRVANQQGAEYNVRKSSSNLVIDQVNLQNELIKGANPPIPITLEVHTTGGATGNALCYYSLDGGRDFILFSISGAASHVQHFSQGFFPGDHSWPILCEDIAGNIAEETASFKIELDNLGPVITRVYNLHGQLHVVTDEESECSFSYESCAFNFEEGNQMINSGKDHATSFESSLTHFVRCRDPFGNPGSCITLTGGI